MADPFLVLLHGRGQEFKDPAMLTTEWLAGLNAGLTRAGRAPVSAEQAVMPFYGNVLYRVTAEAARDRLRLESLPTDEPGPLHPEAPPDVDAVERALLADMAREAGIPGGAAGEAAVDAASPATNRGVRLEGLPDRLLSWQAARGMLLLLSRRTRVDQIIIAAQLRDVAMYLTRGRDAVLEAVSRSIPADVPVVLVSHSLGTVVARDLLEDRGLRERTRLWVTAGSPLGLEAVQRNLLASGTQHPGLPWLSAYDVNDVVALGHPLRKSWGPPLTDVEVENGPEAHSITRYLSHADVADPIGRHATR